MVAQGRPKIESGLFEDLLQSGHRRRPAGRAPDGTASRLLLPLYQRHCHRLRVGSRRPGRADHRPAAGGMKIGFNRFDLGLPGNLVAIPLKDAETRKRAVRRQHEGGRAARREFSAPRTAGQPPASPISRWPPYTASASVSRPTKIFLPLFHGPFDRNDFEGRDYLDRSKDWKSWDGKPFGYEAGQQLLRPAVGADHKGMLREVLFRPTTAK